MKRVIIVHCWDGYPEYCWYPAVKKELEEIGFEVEVPQLPETSTPDLGLWLPRLEQVVGGVDEDLYLVGHSAGCITILRFLEKLGDNQKVGGVVLVAGFTDDLGEEQLRSFFTTPINFDQIKNKANHFVAIHSDNDEFVDLRYGDIFAEKLNAKVIVKHNMDHFAGAKGDVKSVTSLPDVTEAILVMAK